MSLIERVLIGRGPIKRVLIELFLFEREKHGLRSESALRLEAD